MYHHHDHDHDQAGRRPDGRGRHRRHAHGGHEEHGHGEGRHPHGERRHARGLGWGGRGHGLGRGGRHGGPGGRGRPFERGDLRFVLLHLIGEKARHGYELITAIEETFGGAYSPSPGVVYPTLTLLEELGQIAAQAETGGKRLYAITETGRQFLADNRATLDAVLARMDEARRTFAGGPAPEIVRAMQNLHQALSIRLGRGPLGEAQVRAVTDILDRAAVEIERC